MRRKRKTKGVLTVPAGMKLPAFAIKTSYPFYTARIRPMTPEEKTADEKKWAQRAELGDALGRSLRQAYDATLALIHASDLTGAYDSTVLNTRHYLFNALREVNELLQPLAYAVPEAKERGTPGYHDRREAEMRPAQAEMSKESMLAQCAAPVPAGLIQGGGLRGR